MVEHDQYEDPNDRDLLPPQLDMGPSARMARWLNNKFPRAYAAASLIPRLLLSVLWIRKLEAGGMGKRLSRLDFAAHRTSDTVFVFGTGSSINAYPDAWWDVVDRHDSIGMNFFLLHEHVPTFHVMEDVHGVRARLLERRYLEKGDYVGTPLIVKTQVTNLSSKRVTERIDELADLHQQIRSGTYLSVDLLAAGKTVDDMEASYRTLARWGLWRPKRRFLLVSKRRGSVSYVINLAVRAGYRTIVLCGVDLNHTEYFYDSRRDEFAAEGIPVPINDEVGPVHSTNDPEENPVTIHDVILTIDRTILKPAGIQLVVGSETSALYPQLSRFDWERASAGTDRPDPIDASGMSHGHE